MKTAIERQYCILTTSSGTTSWPVSCPPPGSTRAALPPPWSPRPSTVKGLCSTQKTKLAALRPLIFVFLESSRKPCDMWRMLAGAPKQDHLRWIIAPGSIKNTTMDRLMTNYLGKIRYIHRIRWYSIVIHVIISLCRMMLAFTPSALRLCLTHASILPYVELTLDQLYQAVPDWNRLYEAVQGCTR